MGREPNMEIVHGEGRVSIGFYSGAADENPGSEPARAEEREEAAGMVRVASLLEGGSEDFGEKSDGPGANPAKSKVLKGLGLPSSLKKVQRNLSSKVDAIKIMTVSEKDESTVGTKSTGEVSGTSRISAYGADRTASRDVAGLVTKLRTGARRFVGACVPDLSHTARARRTARGTGLREPSLRPFPRARLS